MKKLLFSLAALSFLIGVAAAVEPMRLTDAQMDKVTAAGEGAGDARAQGRAIGDFSADTRSVSASYLDAINNVVIAQARGSAVAASALVPAEAAVRAQATAFLMPYTYE